MKKRAAGWRIDAKWVAGILFTLSLALSLLALSLYRVTGVEQAKELYSPALEALLKEMPDESFAEIAQSGQQSPEQPVQPAFYPFKIDVKGKEVAGRTPDQVRAVLAVRTVEALYAQGSAALTKSDETNPPSTSAAPSEGPAPPFSGSAPEGSDQLSGILNLLSPMFIVMTRGTHDVAWTAFLVSLFPVFVFGLLMVLAAFRFGKLISVGIPLVLLSGPGALVTSVFQALKLAGGKAALARALVDPLWPLYLIVLSVGALLIVAGLSAGLILRLLAKGTQSTD